MFSLGRADCYRANPQVADRGTTFRYEGSSETSRITLTNKQSWTNSSIVRKRRKTSLKILSSTDPVDRPQQLSHSRYTEGKASDRIQLMSLFGQPMQYLFKSIVEVSSYPLNEVNYSFLKVAAQVLVGLGLQLCAVWGIKLRPLMVSAGDVSSSFLSPLNHIRVSSCDPDGVFWGCVLFFLISTQSYQGIKLVELVHGVCWGCVFFFLISTQSYQGIKLVELVNGVCWGCVFFFLISTQSYQGIKLVELVNGVCWGCVFFLISTQSH
ncbi:hypothetical protein LAZ67_1003311 [Cordylochernes scorpioides]|uniref:Uncharacterized protein n=1 Tax=Cordylochernes scorpioides TaxID=51811 RepID=A0ABY6JWU4_9ARAC|nr:hypothetical protein LAZ67_1003311 [Cordylochernes scorpioides]